MSEGLRRVLLERMAMAKGGKVEKRYLRVGDYSGPDHQSYNHAMGRREKGLSVYELDENNQPIRPTGGKAPDEWVDLDLRDRLKGDDPKYVVTGKRVGRGYDGEPVLRGARTLGHWPKDDDDDQDNNYARGGAVRRKKFSFGGDAEGDPGEGIGGVDHETQNDARSDNDQGQSSDQGNLGSDRGSRESSGGGGFGGYDNDAFGGVSPDAGSVDYNGFSDQLAQEGRDLSGLSFDGGSSDPFGGYADTEFGGPAGPARGDYSTASMGGTGGVSMGLDGLGGSSHDQGPLGYSDADFGHSYSVPDVSVPDTPVPGEDPQAGLNPSYGPNLDPMDMVALAALAMPNTPPVDQTIDPPTFTPEYGYPSHVNFSLDPYDKTSLADPRGRWAGAVGLTENAGRLALGYPDDVQAPIENLVGRAAVNYRGYNDRTNKHGDPLYNNDIEQQARAASQYSGVNVKGVEQRGGVRGMVNSNPALADQAYGIAMGVLRGDLDPVTQGQMSFQNPGRGNTIPGSTNFGGNQFYNDGPQQVAQAERAREAYADRQATNQGGLPGGTQVAGDDYSPPGGYSPPSPGVAGSGWQQDVWDDPTSYSGSPARGTPTSFEQSYTPRDTIPDRRGYSGDELNQAPYGMAGATGLGLDPITHGGPAPNIRSLEQPQVASDESVPSDYASGKGHPPQPSTQPQGLPQSLDIGPLEAAHQARTSAYSGYNPDGTFPETGVVAQPMTPAHGPISTAVGALAGAVNPMVGAASTLAGLAGMAGIGPGGIGSILGGHSVPGIDMSRGQQGHEGDRSQSSTVQLAQSPWSRSGSEQPSNPVTGGALQAPKPQTPQNYTIPGYKAPKYRAPRGDLTKYGYGPEQKIYMKDGGLAGAVLKYKRMLDAI